MHPLGPLIPCCHTTISCHCVSLLAHLPGQGITHAEWHSAPDGAVLGHSIIHGIGPQALAGRGGGLGGVLLRDGGVEPEAWGREGRGGSGKLKGGAGGEG